MNIEEVKYHWRFYAEVENKEGLYLGEDYVGTYADVARSAKNHRGRKA